MPLDLLDIEIIANDRTDFVGPLIRLLENLYREASPVELAVSTISGKPLITLTRVTPEPENAKKLILSVNVGDGDLSLYSAAKGAIKLSNVLLKTPVNFAFNSITLIVNAHDTPEEIIEKYNQTVSGAIIRNSSKPTVGSPVATPAVS